MTRPATYAKHTGRRQRKSRNEHQMGLDVDVQFHETTLVEFRLWLDRQRAAGLDGFTLDQFRAESKSVPRTPNLWGTFATNVVNKVPGIEHAGHVRSKVPSAHRRLVRYYRFTGASTGA